ncbi:MAG: helix-turn-helix domain-containing protein [Oscillospiraceae bacterium]|nr:helix-turn-helix domain-containing protein [Oscillospiraceae bacterium]
MQRPATGDSFLRIGLTLLLDENMTLSAIKVYCVLLDMCTKKNNIIRISLNNLKKRASCCRKSVSNALNRLEKYGYIDRLPKAWRTETNTFSVFKILPDKKRNSSKSSEQPDSMPVIQSKPRKPRAEKPKKKKYGEYGRVKLTDEEYNSLLSDFGQEITIRYIQRADDYSKEHKRYYNNNAVTIRKWIEEDRDKPNGRHNCGKVKDNEPFTEEERAGYLRLVNRFREDVLEPIQKSDPEPVLKLEPTPEYEMTDEEITQILDCWNYNIIYRDHLHPLYHRSVGELMDIAERQRKRRNGS